MLATQCPKGKQTSKYNDHKAGHLNTRTPRKAQPETKVQQLIHGHAQVTAKASSKPLRYTANEEVINQPSEHPLKGRRPSRKHQDCYWKIEKKFQFLEKHPFFATEVGCPSPLQTDFDFLPAYHQSGRDPQ